MSRPGKAQAQPKCAQLDPADEIRRFQKLSALLACLQHAVNYDVSDDLQVDVSDALAAVVLLIDHEIDSLDRLATPVVSP